MGGCCSTPEQGRRPAKGARPVQAINISSPQNVMLHVPRPQLDYAGKPVRMRDYQLDRKTLQIALGYMADFLDNQRQDLTIITVGGAINTLLLRTRQATHDVDFFGTNLNNHQRALLEEAAAYAKRRSKTPLGGEWFNNQTMLWMSPPIHQAISREALQQNEVVFQKKGLKLVAAPWHYAMCGKLNRLAGPTDPRPYDIADAASYLNQYIRRHGGPVRGELVKRWCREFHKANNDTVMRAVNTEYRRRYNRPGIVS